MYSPGNILYFNPFYFKNGNTAKPKYFIVLHNDGDNAVLASLPTRTDHVPSFVEVKHGCINADEANFNCYHFEAKKIVTTNHFAFNMPTFVYGSQLDNYQLDLLKETYQVENVEYKIIGTLIKDAFENLIKCFVCSSSVKRKFKEILQAILPTK